MLATTTTDALYIDDPDALRRTASSISPCFDLIDKAVATCWRPDNTALDLCSSTTLYRYSPVSNVVKDMYTSQNTLSCLATKDKTTTFIGEGNVVQVLDCSDGKARVTSTFSNHKSPIHSLSLNNDASILASASPTAVYIHNLSTGSHTALRGVNPNGQRVTTCSFHPHTRTRLLVGTKKSVIVYDTIRSSGPAKSISLPDAVLGDVVSVSSSPFSKTLIAAATSEGFVVLLDLEKEKSISRTINLKLPVTSMDFSPEGAAIFVGTQTGNLVVLQLRTLDKPPRVISVGTSRIETISVQRKAVTKSEPTPRTTSDRRALLSRKPALSPIQTTRSAAPASTSSVARRRPLRETGSAKSPATKSQSPTSTDEISVELDTIGTRHLAVAKSPLKVAPSRSPTSRSSPVLSRPTRSSTISISSAFAARTSPVLSRPTRASTISSAAGVGPNPSAAASSRPRAPSGSGKPIASSSRPSSSATSHRVTSSSSRPSSSSTSDKVSPSTRATTPDFANVVVDTAPITPLRAKHPALGLLGTPDEEDEYLTRSKGKGRSVEFHNAFDDDEEEEDEDKENRGPTILPLRDSTRLTLQVSPVRRPMATNTSGATMNSWTSPVRPSAQPPPGAAAHDLLKSIVQDVMYDYQKQTKADIEGLHLDLLRVGRSWKAELRELMEEYVGDLNDLREENRRLREENERLRRGML
ncbi:hypothetical protein CC1G_10182 [Coprinopsis cinerea okayama7|uniref:WD40 repeat-like protein n=1 Tax=Coprinopsis cinerea (strain Okayama-7 / 130 / ATCC MYA-4618 / FGSC 9003) TaxID=240176 RepID=A8PGC9_COPC7|nr:hypothetical protein CC1G_10182 [Coprinopsis cinerea okayama7\|eukprot:XP_001841185.2 hypothetical protein CC1G_10182 [Coprinopsis cinerea okayama7\